MKIGDQVCVKGIPDQLPPDGDRYGFETTTLFQNCVGRVFKIASFNEAGLVELEVGEVFGAPSYMESIWIEPRFLAITSKKD